MASAVTSKPVGGLKKIATIYVTADYITTDNLGYIYVVKRDELRKYNPADNSFESYSTKNSGNITYVDASNSMKLLLYYKDFTQIVFLDNRLGITGSPILFQDINLQQTTLACSSHNNGIIVYNTRDFELSRLDEKLETSFKTGNITQLTHQAINPSYLLQYTNDIYLSNPLTGILVFDLPDLIQKKGGFVRVYNNLIKENNLANFAPKGNIVGNVPKGTGMMVLATSQVEIFDNKILNHSTVGIAIISYFMTEKKNKDKGYYPYPTSINIHDNLFERKPRRVPMDSRFGQLYRVKLKFGRKIPQVIFDGILDPKLVGTDGKYLPEYAICVRNNINQSTSFLDADHDFKNVLVGPDLFECSPVSIKSNQF